MLGGDRGIAAPQHKGGLVDDGAKGSTTAGRALKEDGRRVGRPLMRA